MSERIIVEQEQFNELCDHIRDVGVVAFDTEFVSENSFRPLLCLLQFATPDHSALVDPFQIPDLNPWWDLMCDEHTTVIVHGGQAEVRFCLWATENAPRKLIDVQLAEGLRSRSYPLSYSNLVGRVLGTSVHGNETRTDWRHRPLSDRQIRYAAEDTDHLIEIWTRQQADLKKLGRQHWAEAEFERYVTSLKADVAEESWQRLPGLHKLSRRGLTIAIELGRWREQEAEKRDRLIRRVLRDDLLLDIARRKPASLKELLATRDMNRGEYRKSADEMLECVKRAMDRSESELPQRIPAGINDHQQDEQVLGKLLGLALANRCAEMNVALQLVGTAADLRQLVRCHLKKVPESDSPRLTRGWRAELCGDLLTEVLDGNVSIRVADLRSEHPLAFDRRDSN
ncbi:MAG: HRDC domain-containing protein [Planctomycetaceae bacterium]